MTNLAGKRVLVTGAHGFIGREVVRLLHDGAVEAICPYRPDTPPVGLPGEHVPLDLRDRSAVGRAMQGVDHVIHLAAQSGGIQFQAAGHAEVLAANQTMTRNVIEAAQDSHVERVYLASSAVIYSRSAPEVIPESAPCVLPDREPVSGYAWSKLTDEALGSWALAAGTDVVVGRFANVYGPGGSFDPSRSTVVHALVKKVVDASPQGRAEVWGDGSAIRSFIFVSDAARAVLQVLLAGTPGEAYNIDASEPVSIRDLAGRIRDIVDPSVELEFDATRPAGTPRRVLDTTRLLALGFAPEVDLADGISATVTAYQRS